MDPASIQRLTAANLALSQGRKQEGVDLLIEELGGNPALLPKLHRILLSNLLQIGRLDQGLHWAARAAELVPQDAELHNLTGVTLIRKGRQTEAIAAFDRVLAIEPAHKGALANKGLLLNARKEGAAAESIFTTLIQLDPTISDFHRALGKALWIQQRLTEAEACLRRAVQLAPNNLDAWLDLSALAVDKSGAAEGCAVLDEAIIALPDQVALVEAKATMLRRSGRSGDTDAYLRSISERFGQTAWYQHEAGHAIARTDVRAAEASFRSAVEADPGEPLYRLSLVENHARMRGDDEGYYLDEAHAILSALPVAEQRRASKTAFEMFLRVADHAAAALGSLHSLGREWAASDRHSPLLLLLSRVENDGDRRELLDQHRLWGDRAIARAAHQPIERPQRQQRPKIRLGLMSSDLREHVVTWFLWPLFEHVDRDRFEIYCYSFFDGAQPGPVQSQLASMVDGFRWQPEIDDRSAAQMIANDDLDILIELGGSTHLNKLDVMAWKPARTCISWLGYPHSSGLDTIDHLIVDPLLNPPDASLLIETPLVMPQSWIAMSERAFPHSHAIDPQPPVLRNGCITFGTANNPYKYNPETVRTWARIVAQVPGSRFLFVRPEAASAVFVRNIRAAFAAAGVTEDRVEFRTVRHAHMPHYNAIDIALDSFPQTGGTTTCEAAWMGVPTVTLVGAALYERLSFSILTNAGLGDLCASSIDDFIRIAVDLAYDTDRIAALRVGLRDQIASGVLGQTEGFARQFYEMMASLR